jgi:hypothetical protein
VLKDGTLPFYRYVIREKGKVEIGALSCSMCHTRVMPDGSIIKGAQGNFPFDRAFAWDYRHGSPDANLARGLERVLFAAPWIGTEAYPNLDQSSIEDIAARHEAIPPGVIARHGTNIFLPAKVPDLIGVEERRYLDATGLVRHRDIGDLMRYAAMNQDTDLSARYAGFRPAVDGMGIKLPDNIPQPSPNRYSDEQLYALGLYIYSLQPPKNPNRFDALAERGKTIFEREACSGCHTPPLYTNNKMTIAAGFEPSAGDSNKVDVLPVSVGTDPRLALETRRGTGYYKVPSLKGLWYRGPFEHNGSVATLEDWFDSKRLRNDYVPTGFKGYGVKTRAVKGHEFGLRLSEEDKRALVAFLKTL